MFASEFNHHTDLDASYYSLSLRDRQLRAFFEGAIDAMLILDDQGRYLDANAAACELFGLSRERLLGRQMTDFLDPGTAIACTCNYGQQGNNGQQGNVREEYCLIRTDGTIRHVECASTRNFLPHRHLAVMRDISDRKFLEHSLQQVNQELQQLNQELEYRVALRTAELQHTNQQLQAEVQDKQQTQVALRQSQAQLNDVLNSAIAVITRFRVFADRNWEYDFYSAGCEAIFGYTAEELKTNKHLWMSRLHPDDRENLIPTIYEEIFAARTTITEYRFHHQDGSLRWLSATYASRWDALEACWIVTAVNTDITDRKQAEKALLRREQQLSLALDAAKAGLWEWDMTTNRTYWSDTNYRLLGYEPGRGETTFEMWLNVIHADDRARVLLQIQTVLEQRIDFQLEYRVVLPDGTIRWINDLGKIIYDAAGQPKSMIGIQIDVTEAAQIKQALCLSNQRKDDFLSTVSHELRAPMANIRMATQMLAISLPDLNQPETLAGRYFQILKDECDREINLINDLLDLSRVESGRIELTLTQLNLHHWLPQALEAFTERTRHQQQALHLDIAPDLPDFQTDITYFQRILTELVHNACKYTPAHEKIVVTAQKIYCCCLQKHHDSDTPEVYLQVGVTNTGVEISADQADRIFEKFYRIPEHDVWRQGGTGLGLSLVKKLTEYLGGCVWFASRTNETTFTLLFPVK